MIPNEYYQKIFNNTTRFARQFLYLPDDIRFEFAHCPSPRFPTLSNASETINLLSVPQLTDRIVVFFNYEWCELNRANNREFDIEFFVFHELRHIHQYMSVARSNARREGNEAVKLQYPETARVVEQWRADFLTYKRNVGDNVKENVTQAIEVDANAYALVLLNLLHIEDDISLEVSMDPNVSELAEKKMVEFMSSRKEIQVFLGREGRRFGGLVEQ